MRVLLLAAASSRWSLPVLPFPVLLSAALITMSVFARPWLPSSCLDGARHLFRHTRPVRQGLRRIPGVVYILRGMTGRYVIEVEPEVRAWLDTLPLRQYAKAEAAADLLAERAETLGQPYTRHLGGKTRELRFALGRGQVRVSYWLAPGRRVVLLTVFAKTRQRERAEVARAIAAQRTCEHACAAGHPGHGPALDIYERKWD